MQLAVQNLDHALRSTASLGDVASLARVQALKGFNVRNEELLLIGSSGRWDETIAWSSTVSTRSEIGEGLRFPPGGRVV